MTKVYRILLFLLGALGIFLQIRADGIGMLMYYTILSNISVTGFLGYLLIAGQDSRIERIKGGITTAIMTTCLVYHFMLAPVLDPAKFYTAENFICHYILPLGFLLDTLLADKESYRPFDPIFWVLIPAVYFVWILLNGLVFKISIPLVDSPYPYFFVNADELGWTVVIRNTLFVGIGYVMLGYALYYIKKGCAKIFKR